MICIYIYLYIAMICIYIYTKRKPKSAHHYVTSQWIEPDGFTPPSSQAVFIGLHIQRAEQKCTLDLRVPGRGHSIPLVIYSGTNELENHL